MSVVTHPLALADWRRRTAELYARVRELHATHPARAHRHWRDVRDQLFTSHSQTPLRPSDAAAFGGLDVYEYEPELAFRAALDTGVPAERYPVTASGGVSIDFVRVGRVVLPIGTLDVFWLDTYGGGLFLPFRDETNGQTTYGGGRYLLDTAKGADLGTGPDGKLIVDLNFAYHPSCHYMGGWNCPLAPSDNRLELPVTAGERRFA